ncbi:SRPBCC family protein [Actinomycetospora endophytica]|uniref:SRPBCC family protein n=1 Tax=Actinomycetospora endophytica TaxID=2291215 RepID=A0ABS8PGS6_9PSEU|nr:SRPBCC family protein [Actinomycetospora endophytica]MCD2197477.1 SRPBCC family protein [Actinomycetospora endophytica]
MGIIATSSETTFRQSPEELYDFVTDPRNWPKTYPGSAGIEGIESVPLQVGDVWSEAGKLEDLECRFTWRLVTAERPWRFEFRSVGLLAHDPDDHSGGFEGITTISYTFTRSGEGVTLFHRSMTTEVPKHGRMAPQVVASHEPIAIDLYHDAVAAALG